MSLRFNTPPNWPRPPVGWSPPPGWRPDPAWEPPPPGWPLWVEDPATFARQPQPLAPRALQPTRNNGSTMVAVAAASCGFAGFVPPLWAARQRPHDASFRRRMYAAAGSSSALVIAGTVMVSGGSEDTAGSPTGLLSDLGGTLLLLNLVFAITVAVLVRNTRASTELPGVAEVLTRRRLREEYRQLSARDPALARSMGIGRPDLTRTFDDGGLVDLNAIPADRLARFTGLPAEEAHRVAERRRELGPFVSLDELALYADLPHATVSILGERAIFL